ncbi:MAG: hypothetical protein WC815_17595 [Vicinamibacterales bacterium]
MKAEIRPLAKAIGGCLGLPLIAVGSGGSLTVAEFAAQLHRDICAVPAFADTPLNAVERPVNPSRHAVLMTSAAGRNPDVIGSFHRIASREPRRLVVLCLSAGSPLATRAAAFPFVDFVEMVPPTARDGFLATNSLIGSAVLLLRAYAEAAGLKFPVPRTWRALVGETPAQVRASLMPATGQRTMIVLHGPDTRAAAVDVESKMTEAALGNVWTADFRHFAHGRHHWLAKRGSESSVIAFCSDGDRELADKTLALLPRDVSVVRQDIPYRGALAALAALSRVMYLAGAVGSTVGIDPGRPGVPVFGRRIYRLNAFPTRRSIWGEEAAIRRKTETDPLALPSNQQVAWRAAYRHFIEDLEAAVFRAVVLDYDGTLCSAKGRFERLSRPVASQLIRLLEADLKIGIATGRGKSVRLRLQEALPRELWKLVTVGYYNGADVFGLDDDSQPNGLNSPGESLREIASSIRSNRMLARLTRVEFRAKQITLEPLRPQDAEQAWALVEQVVTTSSSGASLLRSGHSMDVIALGVDKRNVVNHIRDGIGADAAVLCIGDRGRYPGNDYQLLALPHALSVDECSPKVESGWNLAPIGHRGPEACVSYLGALSASKGRARFFAKNVRRGKP